jgi:hypothetical protein
VVVDVELTVPSTGPTDVDVDTIVSGLIADLP